ncbi:hypothetical protein PFISCL1PPCAC_3726, partial [Pristionchus fissidentatus]
SPRLKYADMINSCALVALLCTFALTTAQMTFSDGWEKRQLHEARRPYHYAHQRVARSGGHAFKEEEEAVNQEQQAVEATENTPLTPITNCMEEYMAGVRQLHAAMMELYTRFQTCENELVNPLLKKVKNEKSLRF